MPYPMKPSGDPAEKPAARVLLTKEDLKETERRARLQTGDEKLYAEVLAKKAIREARHDWIYRVMQEQLKSEAHNVRCRKCGVTARNVLEGNARYPHCEGRKP